MCKISVIVAVYKAEKYMHKCIDSILGQSFRDFELILVDDGSPDFSGKICDEYAESDARVKVIHKSNGGVSSARQAGVDNAAGEYVIHADPDDWVEEDYLKDLYYMALLENADMVICDYVEECGGTTSRIGCRPVSDNCDRIIGSVFRGYSGSCVNKLVRRSALVENSIRFPLEISVGEDMFVFVSLLMCGVRPVYLNKAPYHYVKQINENSLSSSFTIRNYYDNERMLMVFGNLLKGTAHWKVCENYIVRRLVSRSFYYGIFSPDEFRRHNFKYRNAIIGNPTIGIAKRIMFYLACIGLYRQMYMIANGRKA